MKEKDRKLKTFCKGRDGRKKKKFRKINNFLRNQGIRDWSICKRLRSYPKKLKVKMDTTAKGIKNNQEFHTKTI